MPRGVQLILRGLSGLAALMLVAQCSNSRALAPESTTTPVATTTSVAASTSVLSATTSTTIEATTTTTVEPTTTTAAEPTTTTTPVPVVDPNCPTTPHAAVIDRDRQRAWLCDNGVGLPEFVITTARDQPDPATYNVYDKSMNASSRFGGHFSRMTHFVAFARGKDTGARVGFHTLPVLNDGEYVQPLASVGTQMRRGDSSGCIRVLPEQGPVIWDWLQKGDEVRVIT